MRTRQFFSTSQQLLVDVDRCPHGIKIRVKRCVSWERTSHLPGGRPAHLREDLQRLPAEGTCGSPAKAKIFERAAKVAIDYGRATLHGGASPWLRLQHAIFDRLVYSKIRSAMGGNLRYAITGGASLGERLGFFYAGIGLTVMEGYGLTETTASGTFNRAENARIGTVGQPMPGTAVRIADDGEISGCADHR